MMPRCECGACRKCKKSRENREYYLRPWVRDRRRGDDEDRRFATIFNALHGAEMRVYYQRDERSYLRIATALIPDRASRGAIRWTHTQHPG